MNAETQLQKDDGCREIEEIESQINDIIEQVEDSNYDPEKEYELVNDSANYSHYEEQKAKKPEIQLESDPESNQTAQHEESKSQDEENNDEEEESKKSKKDSHPECSYYDDSESECQGKVIELGDEDSEENSAIGFEYLQENEWKYQNEIEHLNNEREEEFSEEIKQK